MASVSNRCSVEISSVECIAFAHAAYVPGEQQGDQFLIAGVPLELSAPVVTFKTQQAAHEFFRYLRENPTVIAEFIDCYSPTGRCICLCPLVTDPKAGKIIDWFNSIWGESRVKALIKPSLTGK